MSKSALVQRRLEANAILHEFADDIALYTLWNWTPVAILAALVREKKIANNQVTPAEVEMYTRSEPLLQKTKEIFGKGVVAVKELREATQVEIDTAQERLDAVAMQKIRLQRLLAKELKDDHYNKQIRMELRELANLLSAEDKRQAENGGSKDLFGFEDVLDNNASSKAPMVNTQKG